MGIPLVDLRAQHEQVRDEVQQGWDAVLGNTSFIQGAAVAEFEASFAAFSGVRHCVGVANGTDALELALRALGIGHGDEVIVPANTFIASPLAVARAGATPVLVDQVADTHLIDVEQVADAMELYLRALEIGPGDEVIVPANTFIASPLAVARAGATPVLVDQVADTHLIDVEQVADAITPRTRAVMPVHLYGQVAPMADLIALARDRGLRIVEDAAQAQGAAHDGRTAGGFGDIAGTSFYPGKNLGAYGDAGGVLTDDADLAAKVRALGNYGSNVKYHHPETGFNSRLDTLQAVVLSAKLRRLAGWNQARRDAAARYDELLADLEEVVRPVTLAGNEHVWHLYVIRVPERDRVLRSLHDAGIGAGIHYPVPVHLQGAFASLGKDPGSYPVAEQAADEILSLPMYAEITPEQQQEVVDALRKALR